MPSTWQMRAFRAYKHERMDLTNLRTEPPTITHKQTERMPYCVRENEERLIPFVHARL